jgi:FemAB-related protein (PEP-CTERM system-associated)
MKPPASRQRNSVSDLPVTLPDEASRVTGKPAVLRTYEGREVGRHFDRVEAFLTQNKLLPLSRHPAWLAVLREGLGHVPFGLEAAEGERTRGWLALAYVRSILFGRFLVSLPYLNTAGVTADDDETAGRLIDRAVLLADELKVRYLELRHERPAAHPALTGRLSSKVHMRLPLPAGPEQLWQQIRAKVRNRVRKGQKSGLSVVWGSEELLPEFYAVFSHTMRDLGTPAYGPDLFRAVLRRFPGRAELCVVRAGAAPAAGALLLHGWGVTEVPSAGALRRYNPTCANMLLYWHLLERALRRRQAVFDFGRSTRGSGTWAFKKQWGARPEPAEWQYYLREGRVGDMRPDNPGYGRLICLWQSLPLSLTRLIGPPIVRGIP